MKRSPKIALAIAAALGLGLSAATVTPRAGAMGHGPMGAQQRLSPEERQKFAQANRAEHGMASGMMHGIGPGAGHPMGRSMAAGVQHDDAFRADMSLVHDLLTSHESIKRTVVNLPDGIRTVTESDDPKVAQTIKAHVASMEQRLKDGREFNLFSPTIPVLFANKDKIKTTVELTDKGVLLVQTSEDPKVVTALQEHAEEVSELARDGMAAMMRSARARMGAARSHR